MKSIGIVRRLDELGRFVIPVEVRRNLSLQPEDSVEIFVDGNNIILKKYAPGCIFCGEVNNTFDFKGKCVCKKCIENIRK